MNPHEISSTPDEAAASALPAELGYRMPAEWEPHEATWLSWPRKDSISFPGSFDTIPPVLSKMVDALYGSENVFINVSGPEHEREVKEALRRNRARSQHVKFFHIPTNEPWCRDHGPTFITKPGETQPA